MWCVARENVAKKIRGGVVIYSETEAVELFPDYDSSRTLYIDHGKVAALFCFNYGPSAYLFRLEEIGAIRAPSKLCCK
jgi:hypothetical protein